TAARPPVPPDPRTASASLVGLSLPSSSRVFSQGDRTSRILAPARLGEIRARRVPAEQPILRTPPPPGSAEAPEALARDCCHREAGNGRGNQEEMFSMLRFSDPARIRIRATHQEKWAS